MKIFTRCRHAWSMAWQSDVDKRCKIRDQTGKKWAAQSTTQLSKISMNFAIENSLNLMTF